MNDLELISYSPQETQRLGRRIGEKSHPGDIFLLTGNLGAGKTCLTQGIAYGLGIDEYTASPSFMLVREYQGRLPLYHMDLYRLDNIEEIADLGLDEYLCGQGACVIEWAEKGLSVLPAEHMMINIDYVSETERRFSFQPNGSRYSEMIPAIRQLSG